MRSGACLIVSGSDPRSGTLASSASIARSSPTSTTFTPCRAASIAPWTSARGQWSPPKASRAIRAAAKDDHLLAGDLDDGAALVVATSRAHAMRQRELLAGRARDQVRRRDLVVLRTT